MDAVLIIGGVVDVVYRNSVAADMEEIPGGAWVDAASDEVFGGYLYHDGVFTAPYVEPPPPPPPVPALVASGVFSVTDGWLEGVGSLAGIGMAFALDVGTYWIMFNDPQPDLAYAAPASSSQGQINVQRQLEYVEVTVRDGSGALFDPSEFSITIMRAL